MAERTNEAAEPADVHRDAVGDTLADAVEAGHGSSPWSDALREFGAVDRATYEAVASTPTPMLDRPFRLLSRSADHSRVWLCLAAAMALVGGQRGRRAAAEGVMAIGATSAIVNLGVKRVFSRRRPERSGPYSERHSPMPTSTSFPSGHSASAFAFAQAVGRHLPWAAVPLRLLAGAVAYSRVHVGVHYPGDVVIGSIIGGGTAAIVGASYDHVAARRS